MPEPLEPDPHKPILCVCVDQAPRVTRLYCNCGEPAVIVDANSNHFFTRQAFDEPKKGKIMDRYVGQIERETEKNNYFRRVLFTGEHSQLVVMCLQPLEEIGDEVHPNVDQFFRVERGEAKFVFNEKQEALVREGDAVVVPAGTYHNVINASEHMQLKLYTIYSPPNHPDGTVHKTKKDAEAAEAMEHHVKD
jgi:mannose-6-phosphate isomerase-like protein (cupin superfamily)